MFDSSHEQKDQKVTLGRISREGAEKEKKRMLGEKGSLSKKKGKEEMRPSPRKERKSAPHCDPTPQGEHTRKGKRLAVHHGEEKGRRPSSPEKKKKVERM